MTEHESCSVCAHSARAHASSEPPHGCEVEGCTCTAFTRPASLAFAGGRRKKAVLALTAIEYDDVEALAEAIYARGVASSLRPIDLSYLQSACAIAREAAEVFIRSRPARPVSSPVRPPAGAFFDPKSEEDLARERVGQITMTDYDDENGGIRFADPSGRSSLRAASRKNPRNFPCPTCGAANVLTPADVRAGYQCDRCADRLEGFGY